MCMHLTSNDERSNCPAILAFEDGFSIRSDGSMGGRQQRKRTTLQGLDSYFGYPGVASDAEHELRQLEAELNELQRIEERIVQASAEAQQCEAQMASRDRTAHEQTGDPRPLNRERPAPAETVNASRSTYPSRRRPNPADEREVEPRQKLSPSSPFISLHLPSSPYVHAGGATAEADPMEWTWGWAVYQCEQGVGARLNGPAPFTMRTSAVWGVRYV